MSLIMAKFIRSFVLFIILVPVLGLGIFAYYFQRNITEVPLEIPKSGYVLLVTPGMPVYKIADRLSKDGLLEFPKLFQWWVYITNVHSQLKAGEYFVKEGSTAEDVINLLVSGKVIQHPLTIVEGWNFETLMQAVNQAPELKHTLLGLTPKEIMAKLGHAGIHPEGHFFPDTYYFPLGTTDLAFLQRAYGTMQEKLKNAWEKRGKDLSLKNPYEALILASIIEKESCNFGEYSEISGVFHRRLRQSMPLQADPTVIYAAGKAYTGTITTDLLKLANPYNTYVNLGLPPTPIAMPSEKAILAAIQPKKGETLYFVARGDCKGHVFSKTLEQHQVAVNQYRKTLQNQPASKPSLTLVKNPSLPNQSVSSVSNQFVANPVVPGLKTSQIQTQNLAQMQEMNPFEIKFEAESLEKKLEHWILEPTLTPVQELENKLKPTLQTQSEIQSKTFQLQINQNSLFIISQHPFSFPFSFSY